jgi:hypothetical protein
MTERTLYSCNWCHKSSPTAGGVPNDWLVGFDLDGSTKLHLCETCKLIRRHHLIKAIAEAHGGKPCTEPDHHG